MSRPKPFFRRKHLAGSFIWDANKIAYASLRCGACKARRKIDPCVVCVETGIDAIPWSEVMSSR